MATFKVVDTRPIPSTAEGRIGRFDRMITYELDPLTRRIVIIHKDQIEEADIIKAVKKDLAERERFTGKEFQL